MSKSTSDQTVRNPSDTPAFGSILERNLSRRAVMRGGLCALAGLGAASLAPGPRGRGRRKAA